MYIELQIRPHFPPNQQGWQDSSEEVGHSTPFQDESEWQIFMIFVSAFLLVFSQHLQDVSCRQEKGGKCLSCSTPPKGKGRKLQSHALDGVKTFIYSIFIY